jgi:hypothetical protein
MKDMKFSAITLLLAGALGFVLGTLNSDRQPHIALAQTSAAARPANDGKLNLSSLARIPMMPNIAVPASR